MWNIWGGLPHPNIYSPFDDDTLGKVIYALGAYEGENARNDYRRMVVGRALLGAVLGTETVFGFGSASASELPNAGLFTEVVRLNGEWREGQRRVLDDSNVCVAPLENAKSLEAWMNSPSPQQMYRDQQ
jgi:hypothetical protein